MSKDLNGISWQACMSAIRVCFYPIESTSKVGISYTKNNKIKSKKNDKICIILVQWINTVETVFSYNLFSYYRFFRTNFSYRYYLRGRSTIT